MACQAATADGGGHVESQCIFFCDGNLSSNESWTRTKDGCWYFSDPTDDDLSEVSLCIITRYRLLKRLLPLPLLCFDPQECWTIPTQCGKISGIVYGRRGAEAAAFCDNENGCSVVWSTAQRKSFASLGNKGVSLHLWHQNSEPFRNGRQITMLKAIWWVS